MQYMSFFEKLKMNIAEDEAQAELEKIIKQYAISETSQK